MTMELANWLIETLPSSGTDLFNPWRNRCNFDTPTNGPEARLARLAAHLNCDARWILVGEAPGYQGCRYTGVAFTSERLLLEGQVPRQSVPEGRLVHRARPFSEPSATLVYRALYRAGIAETTVLWNALQLHPHRCGKPWTNRPPTPSELALGTESLKRLVQAFPRANVIAVGRKAEALVASSGVRAVAAIRHPANGGASLFTHGLIRLVDHREPSQFAGARV
ncbi:Uracil DNA glycosylase superfamily protein [Aquimonas voraii]|uniref:Uracil DNA glycosylase superfamily protein n=2 Tax=Aquimonas voraii TaxID=265719 RepID=A0A1G6ZTD8_9GAMM|nr:Uracil DNA glycosylase superfamily protein [Aquimonas voraii]